MSFICQRLSQFFRQYPDRPIVIAYSGGVDSQVLLHALSTLHQQGNLKNLLSVHHVNHGLSENAKQWQQMAEHTCQQLGLPLTISQVEVKAQPQQSLEALARDARYQALTTGSPGNALIVTGHHQDDQAETFLLALKRGAGLKGLSAMSPELALGSQLLVRPLLDIRRRDIEEYAWQHQLSWVEDESNQDTAYDRNFLRHEILPLLNRRWPSFTETVKRSAEHCQEGQSLLTELAQQDFELCACADDVMLIAELKKLSRARFNNLLRYFLLRQQSLMPSAEQLNQVFKQMSAARDKMPAVKVGNNWLRRFKDKLFFTRDFKDVSAWQYQFTFDEKSKQHAIEFPDGLGVLRFNLGTRSAQELRLVENKAFSLIAPEAGQSIHIRFAHSNPKCLPEFRQQRRPLKKVLQELAIPPWQRQRIPFIYFDDTLVAALGYFACKEYLPQEGKAQLNVLWLDSNKSG